MTAKQVATMLQVSERTIMRLVTADLTLPVLRIGKIMRFDRDRLLVWLRRRSQGMATARTRAIRLERKETP